MMEVAERPTSGQFVEMWVFEDKIWAVTFKITLGRTYIHNVDGKYVLVNPTLREDARTDIRYYKC